MASGIRYRHGFPGHAVRRADPGRAAAAGAHDRKRLRDFAPGNGHPWSHLVDPLDDRPDVLWLACGQATEEDLVVSGRFFHSVVCFSVAVPVYLRGYRALPELRLQRVLLAARGNPLSSAHPDC